MASLKRVLFLFSDTGGGHRSAAEAVLEALQAYFPGRCQAHLVDVLKSYAPTPFRQLPLLYPGMVRLPRAWGLGYRLSDGHRRARAITAAVWPYMRLACRRLVTEHPADLLVSFHPLLNAPLLKALGPARPPFYTVVTDLVTTHALWYHHQVDLCIVATENARLRGLAYGMRPEQMRVVGLPVAQRFCCAPDDPRRLRARLGWPQDRPVVLLVGGGEGMGPLYETARALARRGGALALAVVCGRNRGLRARLEAVRWEVPTFIYGFERRMPEMMQAASLLVTKAGPGTISEALNAGLPMVLYSYLPGQEEGNVDFVVKTGAGCYAPGPEHTAAAALSLLQKPQELQRAAQTCRQMARPQAAAEIAELIANAFQGTTIKSGHRGLAAGYAPERVARNWR